MAHGHWRIVAHLQSVASFLMTGRAAAKKKAKARPAGPKKTPAKVAEKKAPDRKDRADEFKKRWMEKKLETEPANSIAVKTWTSIRTGRAMKEQRDEFLTNYSEHGDFRFVTALKWNHHLYTEDQLQSTGWLTEAMILDKESWVQSKHYFL